MSEYASSLYWLGNVAKTRIVLEVLEQSSGSAPVTIFDYGCGDGGDWPSILRDHPHLRLVAFEPGADSFGKAVKRLAGCDDAEVRDHCRTAAPHVRGCWVIDLLIVDEAARFVPT